MSSLAHFYYMIDNTETSELYAMKSLELNPRSRLALTTLAEIRYRQDRVHESLRYFKEAFAVHPRDTYTVLRLAQILVKMKRFEDAVTTLEKAREIHPDDPGILKDLQVAYAFAGRIEDADRLDQIILELSRQRQSDQEDMLYSGLQRMEPSKALRQLRIILASPSFRSNLRFYELAADLAIRESGFEEAVGYLEFLQNRQPRSSSVTVKLAECFTRTGRPDRSLEILRQPHLHQSDIRILLARIDALHTMGKLQESMDMAVKGLLDHPRNRRLRKWVTQLRKKGFKPSPDTLN